MWQPKISRPIITLTSKMLRKTYVYNSGQRVSKFDAGIGLQAILRKRLQRKDFLPPVIEPRRLAAASHFSVLES
jgi:hypothetical protein